MNHSKALQYLHKENTFQFVNLNSRNIFRFVYFIPIFLHFSCDLILNLDNKVILVKYFLPSIKIIKNTKQRVNLIKP